MTGPRDPRDQRTRELAEGIGWMVMAAASLDVSLAMLISGLDPDRNWMTIAAQPGGPLRELRRFNSQLPAGARSAPVLRSLHGEASEALDERHRITHTLHGLVIGYADGTTRVGSNHPRGRADLAMPTTEELAELTKRLRKAAQVGRGDHSRHPRGGHRGRSVSVVNPDCEGVPVEDVQSEG